MLLRRVPLDGARWRLRVCCGRFSGAVLRESGDAFAVEVQVHQHEAGTQSGVVLGQPQYRTLSKPKTRLRMLKAYSTFALTFDLLRFFFSCNSSICYPAKSARGGATGHRATCGSPPQTRLCCARYTVARRSRFLPASRIRVVEERSPPLGE
jgi:hypothetical protein